MTQAISLDDDDDAADFEEEEDPQEPEQDVSARDEPTWPANGFLQDDNYGLLVPDQVVVVRAYGEDGDDQILSELRPRYIVMYDPSQDFVRRIEVRSCLGCMNVVES